MNKHLQLMMPKQMFAFEATKYVSEFSSSHHFKNTNRLHVSFKCLSFRFKLHPFFYLIEENPVTGTHVVQIV